MATIEKDGNVGTKSRSTQSTKSPVAEEDLLAKKVQDILSRTQHKSISGSNKSNSDNSEQLFRPSTHTRYVETITDITQESPSPVTPSSSPNDDQRIRFKQLVARQRDYLKCLQKELKRLEKMEDIFAKIHQKNKEKVAFNKNTVGSNILINSDSHTNTNISTITPSSSKSKDSKFITLGSDKSTTTQTLSSKSSIRFSSSSPSDAYTSSPSDQIITQREILTTKPSFSKFHDDHLEQRTKATKPKSIPYHRGLEKAHVVVKSQKENISPKKSRQNAMRKKEVKSVATQTINMDVKNDKKVNHNEDIKKCWFIPLKSHIKSVEPLQAAFKKNCQKMIANSQKRVNQIYAIKILRKRSREQMTGTLKDFEDRLRMVIKPDPNEIISKTRSVKIKRVFSHKEMRNQAKMKYTMLPEVKARKEQQKKELNMKRNRLISQIFTNRLKQNALKGKVSWPLNSCALEYY